MADKIARNAKSGKSLAVAPKKPLVFTTTTTTTTTKHFTFDKNAVDFEQIKLLLENGGSIDANMLTANDTQSSRPSMRTSFVKPRKCPLGDIQNRRSTLLSNKRQPTQWTVSNASTSDVGMLQSVRTMKMKKMNQNGDSSVQNGMALSLTKSSYNLNVSRLGSAHRGNEISKLSMSRVSNINVAPWQAEPVRTMAYNQCTPMKGSPVSQGAIPKQPRIKNEGMFNAHRFFLLGWANE